MIHCIAFRHGETDWNNLSRCQGQQDIPLNEYGKYQALSLRETVQKLNPDCIYSSPLTRAYETAKLACQYIPLEIKKQSELMECDFGNYTGASFQFMSDKELETFKKTFSDGQNPLENKNNFPQGESKFDVCQRLLSFLSQIDEQKSDKTVLLFTHKGILCTFWEMEHKKYIDILSPNYLTNGGYISFNFDASTQKISCVKFHNIK